MPREAPTVDQIGSCKLAIKVNTPSDSQARNLAKQPNANNGTNGRIYNAIEKWYNEKLAIDGTPFLGGKLNEKFTSGGSMDHVWEKSNVRDFLAFSLRCDFDYDKLLALFFPCSGKNLLQKIYEELPSMDSNNVQAGFSATNKNLNGMKVWMFSQGYSESRFDRIYNTNEKILGGLERQATLFNLFYTDPGIQSMHDQAINCIYQAFSRLNNYIAKTKIQCANKRGDLFRKFATSFRDWYGELLSKKSMRGPPVK